MGSTPTIQAAQTSGAAGKAELQVNLVDFIRLTPAEKAQYIKVLEGDPRFSALIPQLKAALEPDAVAKISPTPSKVAPVGLGYGDIAHLLNQIQLKGDGDGDHWFRTFFDNVNAIHAFEGFVSDLAAAETGQLRGKLEAFASRLARVSDQGDGDLYYWRDRTCYDVNTVSATAAAINELAASGKASLTPKQALARLAALIRSTTSEGFGGISYWMRAALNTEDIACAAGESLAKVAERLGEPHKTRVMDIANELQAKSSRAYVHDPFYWRGTTYAAVARAYKLATSIDEVVRAL